MSDQASLEQVPLDERTLAYLRALSVQYPNTDATLAAIANLRAALTLPKGTVHVISDIHGEFKKLIHVIKNASGCLRPLVEQTFGKAAHGRREVGSPQYYLLSTRGLRTCPGSLAGRRSAAAFSQEANSARD